MNLEKARELIGIQAKLGSGYNRNATRLVLREIQKRARTGGRGHAHPGARSGKDFRAQTGH